MSVWGGGGGWLRGHRLQKSNQTPHPGSSSLESTGLHGVDLLVVLHVRYLRHGPQHVPQSLGANGKVVVL